MDSEAIGGTGTSKDGWKREKERKKKSWKKFLSPKNSKTGFWWWPVGSWEGRSGPGSGESPATLSEMSFFVQLLPGTSTTFLYREEVVENENWKIF
jgi:hypothetical protein